jgi:hypothetical protein
VRLTSTPAPPIVTIDAAWTVLGSYSVPKNTSGIFEATVLGQNESGTTAAFIRKCLVKRGTGDATVYASTDVFSAREVGTWDVMVVLDSLVAPTDVRILVRGDIGYSVAWQVVSLVFSARDWTRATEAP